MCALFWPFSKILSLCLECANRLIKLWSNLMGLRHCWHRNSYSYYSSILSSCFFSFFLLTLLPSLLFPSFRLNNDQLTLLNFISPCFSKSRISVLYPFCVYRTPLFVVWLFHIFQCSLSDVTEKRHYSFDCHVQFPCRESNYYCVARMQTENCFLAMTCLRRNGFLKEIASCGSRSIW